MTCKKTILITGGAGFIGSNLAKVLVKSGHQIICVDNLSSGSIVNLEGLAKSPNFDFLEHDITHPLPLSLKVDEIYNLACPASPEFYQKQPVETLQACTQGVINLLEFSRINQVRLLQASTSEIYGDPQVHPQKEDYWGHVNPIGLRSCYDEGKRCAEALAFAYHRQHQASIKVARIFNTYGPNMQLDDGRVISNFIVRALSGEDLAVYGDGSQTRSFCFIDDLTEGLISLMEKSGDITGPVNLGMPSEISIATLAKRVLKLTGSTSSILYSDLPRDDPRRRQPDISMARAKLDWEPETLLDRGLIKTIQYFERQLKTS